jgi:hypothetical protein
LQSIFIPVHFIDILYTLFSQRIKLYSRLDPFFKIERERKKGYLQLLSPFKKRRSLMCTTMKNIENVLGKY